MTPFQRKVGVRVLAGHGIVIFLLVFTPLMRGCFKPKTTEIVTFVEFGSPSEAIDLQEITQIGEPEQPPQEPVVPEPAPPEPAPEESVVPVPDKPKPVEPPKPKPVDKPKPKPVEPPKPKPVDKPKPKEPDKTKSKVVKPEDIKIGKKIVKKPAPAPKPSLTAADIRKALSGVASPKGGKPGFGSSAGNPSEFNDYYVDIMTLFYNQWSPPATASSATKPVIVRITMAKDGRILKRAKIERSGDELYDRTVMDAVNKVSSLPKPPASYPYDYVDVIFTLER